MLSRLRTTASGVAQSAQHGGHVVRPAAKINASLRLDTEHFCDHHDGQRACELFYQIAAASPNDRADELFGEGSQAIAGHSGS